MRSMFRIITTALLLAPGPSFAQQAEGHHGGGTIGPHMSAAKPARAPTEPGQSAFAAIQEIVEILESDPETDWSRVDIEALRQHLIDMDNVTLRADVSAEPIASGVRFTARGGGGLRDSIRRMLDAHAGAMNGVDGWKFAAAQIEDGATLTVMVPEPDVSKVRALGLLGVMTHGMHHQAHHLMIARGEHPHR